MPLPWSSASADVRKSMSATLQGARPHLVAGPRRAHAPGFSRILPSCVPARHSLSAQTTPQAPRSTPPDRPLRQPTLHLTRSCVGCLRHKPVGSRPLVLTPVPHTARARAQATAMSSKVFLLALRDEPNRFAPRVVISGSGSGRSLRATRCGPAGTPEGNPSRPG